jgi:two-component system cell cycle sensor histidine kinase/response regulator CckA
MNLCLNARDAMPDGGRLTISTGTADLDQNFCERHPWAHTGTFSFFAVRDTGCGMDDDTRHQIFEPFYTTKEPGRGTGLGLSTAYGIVKQHGGMIDVESAPGQGTTITVYLPLTDQPVDQREKPVELALAVGGQETILLAEDEDAVREWVTEVLEEAGYAVLQAENGQAALQLFEEHADSVDLALIDAVMPELSGFDLCQHILGRRPDVKILFCSGYSVNTIPGDFLEENNLQLLQKPFISETLLRCVRETLDGQPALAAH